MEPRLVSISSHIDLLKIKSNTRQHSFLYSIQYLKLYSGMLARIQRRAALRVVCGYRTISADAAGVLAGMAPVDLMALERREMRSAAMNGESLAVARNSARTALMGAWQSRWSDSQKGRWTWKLIPDIAPWVLRRHGQVSFRLTQLLTGHGCFGSYLVRIGAAHSAATTPTTQSTRCPSAPRTLDAGGV